MKNSTEIKSGQDFLDRVSGPAELISVYAVRVGNT